LMASWFGCPVHGWPCREGLAGSCPMSGQVIAVRVDGIDLLVEASGPVGTENTSAADRASEAFERAQDAIVAVSTRVAGTIGDLMERGVRPNKVEVEFGLKFTMSGNVIVASGSSEVSLKVVVGYDLKRNQPAASPEQMAS
jgi:flavin-binding protein dodecin